MIGKLVQFSLHFRWQPSQTEWQSINGGYTGRLIVRSFPSIAPSALLIRNLS